MSRFSRLGIAVAFAALFACHSRGPLPKAGPRAASERDAMATMFARSYFPGRSGQIFLVPEKGNFLLSRPDDVYRFMHGSPWDYDVKIPLLFYGDAFVQKGTFTGPAHQQDVAPTVLALLEYPVPSTMTGRVLSQALSGSGERPKAMLLAVLDGLGSDTFDRMASSLPTLSRLRDRGAWFPDAEVNYLPSVTSAGHATIATGTDPRFHGIQANATFDRRTGKSNEPFPGLSPQNYMTLTLADHWNLATYGHAVILAQGTTPRAAVALGGHGACTANGRPIALAMFDERSAGWVTNDECFRLPDYLKDDKAEKLWKEASESWMGHKIDSGRTLLRSALFSRFQVDALVRMIGKERVGDDETPDLLLVNFKTPDYVSHQYGPESMEMAESLRALDQDIARVLKALDEAVGPGGYAVALTADHGMPPEPSGNGEERRYVEDMVAAIHERFDSEGKLILDFDDPANHQIYVDLDRLAKLDLTLDRVAGFVEEMPFIRYAITEDEVRAARIAP